VGHPFVFAWPVAEAGYDLDDRNVENGGGPATVTMRRGPVRYYRPLEHEALWRKFAEECAAASDAKILGFVQRYGLLAAKPAPSILDRHLDQDYEPPVSAESEEVPSITDTAYLLALIAQHLDRDERDAAANLLRRYGRAGFEVTVAPAPSNGRRPQVAFVPASLRDVLLLQAAEAIAERHEFRRCRNERCAEWFRIGGLDSDRHRITKRREFCSTRCRVAAADARHRQETYHA
jgi:hypothetical protein